MSLPKFDITNHPPLLHFEGSDNYTTMYDMPNDAYVAEVRDEALLHSAVLLLAMEEHCTSVEWEALWTEQADGKNKAQATWEAINGDWAELSPRLKVRRFCKELGLGLTNKDMLDAVEHEIKWFYDDWQRRQILSAENMKIEAMKAYLRGK
ncbi:hypothetical protein AB6T85_23640 [Erwinia sp. ACCC 02193]|uniref:Uncharacterized protein n=1 Tax=Erwinia aeris TaxID=3239803 RepID=A0ABV4EF51_9GAMM